MINRLHVAQPVARELHANTLGGLLGTVLPDLHEPLPHRDEEAPLPPTLTIALGRPAADIREARLHLQGMRPPRQSYEVRVFLGEDSSLVGIEIFNDARKLCFCFV